MTRIGSTAGHEDTRWPARVTIRSDQVEARRVRRLDVLAPLPPEVLGDAVAGRQPGLAARRRRWRRRSPRIDDAPGRPCRGRPRPAAPTWPRGVDADVQRAEHHGRAAGDRQRQHAAEREADEHVQPYRGRGPRAVQRSSTPPEEKKNTSYGVMAAPNSAIGVVGPVPATARPPACRPSRAGACQS